MLQVAQRISKRTSPLVLPKLVDTAALLGGSAPTRFPFRQMSLNASAHSNGAAGAATAAGDAPAAASAAASLAPLRVVTFSRVAGLHDAVTAEAARRRALDARDLPELELLALPEKSESQGFKDLLGSAEVMLAAPPMLGPVFKAAGGGTAAVRALAPSLRFVQSTFAGVDSLVAAVGADGEFIQAIFPKCVRAATLAYTMCARCQHPSRCARRAAVSARRWRSTRWRSSCRGSGACQSAHSCSATANGTPVWSAGAYHVVYKQRLSAPPRPSRNACPTSPTRSYRVVSDLCVGVLGGGGDIGGHVLRVVQALGGHTIAGVGKGRAAGRVVEHADEVSDDVEYILRSRCGAATAGVAHIDVTHAAAYNVSQ